MPADIVFNDDMDTDHEASDVYAPPAHVAARIYKKTTAAERRKSSAASSRRSSISSRHSHQSTLSAHGGSQSRQIAQHLRRASIIESRKARLADRAAHAEQVRLRAALAKATPRGTLREDRALAAQAAREKLLAEITARCEEEVRRAKKIAEENKEKKAAELARLREEAEQKHAEAAKRRLQYQQTSRRPRTSSLPRVEEKKVAKNTLKQMSKVTAAKIIQKQWRSWRAIRAAKEFDVLPLLPQQTQDMSFEEVSALLSSADVLQATARLLKLFGMIDEGAEDLSERGSVRVFLSSFLILAHPKQTFSHGGSDPQEQELLGKAGDLSKQFRRALDATLASGCSASDESLQLQFHSFTSTFHAWKSQDSTALIDIMINQFVELDLILQTVKDDKRGGAADEYHAAIRTNQIQLLARLKRFAGPDKALDLVRNAVRNARKQQARSRKTPSAKDVPRAAASVDQDPAIEAETLAAAQAVVQASLNRPSLPAQDQGAALMQHLRQSMTPIPSNREVSHEILVNGFFEVQQRPWTEARRFFTDALHVGTKQSLEAGGNLAASGWIRSMAILIREKLLSLVTRRHPLYDKIESFLDIQLIDQTSRAGLFSYGSFFETIASIVSQICSPGRDDAVKAFAHDRNGDPIDRLFMLVDILDLMTLDHINYGFRVAGPTVLEHGFEHERATFGSMVSSGEISLEKTKNFWKQSRRTLTTDSRTRDGANSTNAAQIVYTKALVDLVLSNNDIDSIIIPETLSLDCKRLLSLRATAFKMAATAAILLTSKIRLRRSGETRWGSDADRIMNLDFSACSTNAQRIVSIVESHHLMPEVTRDALLSFVSRVLPPATSASTRAAAVDEFSHPAVSAASSAQPADSNTSSTSPQPTFSEPLATHLLRTLHSHVLQRLSVTSTAERVRVTTSAAETLARAGMPEFVAEVGKMVDILEKIRKVDLGCHGCWYEEVAKEVEAELEGENESSMG